MSNFIQFGKESCWGTPVSETYHGGPCDGEAVHPNNRGAKEVHVPYEATAISGARAMVYVRRDDGRLWFDRWRMIGAAH